MNKTTGPESSSPAWHGRPLVDLMLVTVCAAAFVCGCEADQEASEVLDGASDSGRADASNADSDDVQHSDDVSADSAEDGPDADTPDECPGEIREAQWSRIEFTEEGFGPTWELLVDDESFNVSSVGPGSLTVSDGVRSISVLFDARPDDVYVLAQDMAVRVSARIYPDEGSYMMEVRSPQGRLLWSGMRGNPAPFRPGDPLWGSQDVGSCMNCFTCDANEEACEVYDFKRLVVRLSEPPTVVDSGSRATLLTPSGDEYLVVNQVLMDLHWKCGADRNGSIVNVYLALTHAAPAE